MYIFEHNTNNLGQVVYCVASWNANKVCSLAGWPLVMKPGNVMCHLCGWEVHSYSGIQSSTKQIYLGLFDGKHELRLETGVCCQDERCEGPQQERWGRPRGETFKLAKLKVDKLCTVSPLCSVCVRVCVCLKTLTQMVLWKISLCIHN